MKAGLTERRTGDVGADGPADPVVQIARRRRRTCPSPGEDRRKPDRRASATMRRIFEATTQVMLESGVASMSVRDIAAAAGISRGTLYRYFAGKQELLEAYSEHMQLRFGEALVAAVTPHTTPDARFDAFLDFFERYFDSERARHFLTVEPIFALAFFRRSFPHAVRRTQDALRPTFDEWERKMRRSLDRELVAELILRHLISNILVPAQRGSAAIATQVMAFIRNDAGFHAGLAPSRKDRTETVRA